MMNNNNKISIKRGCQNNQCFCTGKCNEIIRYRDKLFNEMYPENFIKK